MYPIYRQEVNLAVYLFECGFLFDHIFELSSKNKQSEFYLTDLIEMASQKGLKILACKEKDEASTLGINSRQHLAIVGNIMQNKLLENLMENGVTIVDPAQILIGPDCEIANDTTIWPGSVIKGNSIVGPNSEIGPNSVLTDAKIGRNCKVPSSVIENASIEDNTNLKPFSHISSVSSN